MLTDTGYHGEYSNPAGRAGFGDTNLQRFKRPRQQSKKENLDTWTHHQNSRKYCKIHLHAEARCIINNEELPACYTLKPD